MWFNPIMKWLISSPFHYFVSKHTMLITYIGRKSGKTFSTPINFLKDGDRYYSTSLRKRVWWRNLRGGDSVQLMVKRKWITAVPKVIEKEDEIVNQLCTYFSLAPNLARYYKVALGENGVPNEDDLTWIAKDLVVIEFKLEE